MRQLNKKAVYEIQLLTEFGDEDIIKWRGYTGRDALKSYLEWRKEQGLNYIGFTYISSRVVSLKGAE